MNLLHLAPYIAGGGGAAALAAGVYLWMRSRRKTAEQMERERRLRLARTGRLSDGTLLDFRDEDGHKLLLYRYDVSGVSYEAAQDITHLGDVVDVKYCRLGGATGVKYDPQNPGNSIVVSEEWTGLRMMFGRTSPKPDRAPVPGA